MKNGYKRLTMTLSILLISGLLTSACSSRHVLKVEYQLPIASTELSGREVSLSFQDMRSSDIFVTPNAKKKLDDFSGIYSLVVLQNEKTGDLIGAYDVPSLFREILRQRLHQAGIESVSDTNSAPVTLEFGLKEFSLDYADSKWKMRMGYQAALMEGQKLLAQQTINGSAERLKVYGQSDAEKLIAELVTDMINKLDLPLLYKQAGL